MNKHYSGLLAAGSLSALLLTGATLSAHAATSATEPSILAMNQKIKDGQLAVDYAYLPAKGYAVVYGTDADGKPLKEPLGHVELGAGSHFGFSIKLNGEPPKGSKLWVSLYADKDGKAGFDRSRDVSFWTERLPSENQITVQ